MRKMKVGLLGATGMVGQRFIQLLEKHPWFEVSVVAASERSTGKTYLEAVNSRWLMQTDIPKNVIDLIVRSVNDVERISEDVDFVFSALDMEKEALKTLETNYVKKEVPVVSNNSAHRWTQDVPMIIPEINPEHLKVILSQKKRLGTKKGFIVVKPNCSIQTYVPALHALREFKPKDVSVCTYQALSGAGKTFETWPEMVDNVIPFISGEEEKSEKEPLKIWGHIENGHIINSNGPRISAQCIRVPVSDGHLAATSVSFERKSTQEKILELWREFKGKPQELKLPSAPEQFLMYYDDEKYPQTKLQRDEGNGMAIALGRLRSDNIFDYKFVSISHNTIRGAAGGAILTAELLKAEGYFE